MPGTKTKIWRRSQTFSISSLNYLFIEKNKRRTCFKRFFQSSLQKIIRMGWLFHLSTNHKQMYRHVERPLYRFFASETLLNFVLSIYQARKYLRYNRSSQFYFHQRHILINYHCERRPESFLRSNDFSWYLKLLSVKIRFLLLISKMPGVLGLVPHKKWSRINFINKANVRLPQ